MFGLGKKKEESEEKETEEYEEAEDRGSMAARKEKPDREFYQRRAEELRASRQEKQADVQAKEDYEKEVRQTKEFERTQRVTAFKKTPVGKVASGFTSIGSGLFTPSPRAKKTGVNFAKATFKEAKGMFGSSSRRARKPMKSHRVSIDNNRLAYMNSFENPVEKNLRGMNIGFGGGVKQRKTAYKQPDFQLKDLERRMRKMAGG
jgi:hypothetical protein